jgi:oligosaccharide repeat unit polymerase
MAIIGYIIIWGLFEILTINKFHKKLNYLMVFNTIWCFFGALSCLGLYGFRTPRLYTHFLIWLFVITVNVVLLYVAKKGNVSEAKDNLQVIAKRSKYVEIIALLLLVSTFIHTVQNYMTYGQLSLIRMAYFNEKFHSGYIQGILFESLPLNMISGLIIIFTLLAAETKLYKYLLLAVFNVVLLTFINGGRYTLILLVYSIIIVWLGGRFAINRIIEKRGKKYQRKLRTIVGIVVFVLVVITALRGQSLLRSIYGYFTGSLSFLDYIIENPATFKLNQPLWGYLTFSAILEPIVLVLKFVGFTAIKVSSYEFNIVCQSYYDVGASGSRVMINANTSIIYYFLRDFGIVGVLIGGLFIGLITAKAYNKWKKGSFLGGIVFIYLMVCLFNSLMTYQFFGQDPIYKLFTFWIVTQHLFTIKKQGI